MLLALALYVVLRVCVDTGCVLVWHISSFLVVDIH